MVAESRLAILLAMSISFVTKFVEGNVTEFAQAQLQCEGSGYCAEAPVTYAICTNENGVSPSWNCVPTFRVSGYAFATYSVECPTYSSSRPCVPENSCWLRYTLDQTSQPIALPSGVGGGVLLIVGCLILYYCCLRKKETQTSEVNTIPSGESSQEGQPPRGKKRRNGRRRDPSPSLAVTQTNVTVHVAVPTAKKPAPAPVHNPQPHQGPKYAAPAPPFNPQYAPTAPSRKRYH